MQSDCCRTARQQLSPADSLVLVSVVNAYHQLLQQLSNKNINGQLKWMQTRTYLRSLIYTPELIASSQSLLASADCSRRRTTTNGQTDGTYCAAGSVPLPLHCIRITFAAISSRGTQTRQRNGRDFPVPFPPFASAASLLRSCRYCCCLWTSDEHTKCMST